MGSFLLIEGDKATFNAVFGLATVVVQLGTLSGSAKETLGGKKLCIQGDEKSVSVPGCMYTTPIYSITGTGILKIEQLASDQVAQKKMSSGKPVLLAGSTFTAKFQVQVPAQKPSAGSEPPQPDPTIEYTGSGRFVTTNIKWQAN